MKRMVVLSTAFVVDRSHMNGLRLLEIDRDLTPNSTHCKFSGFFVHFSFMSFFLSKIVHREFICGTTINRESIGDL